MIYLKIQPYGEYIVLGDVDLSGGSSNQYRFGHDNLQFEGKIDFNGKTLTRDVIKFQAPVFSYTGSGGTIENIVLDIKINNEVVGSIDKGFMVLVGITDSDNKMIVDKMVDKLINLRIFEDENDKLNLSLLDVKGSILSISQFTLYANCKKGRRPSFIEAAKPDISKPLYEYFNQQLKEKGVMVETGVFGAMMEVSLVNDGPVTIILDSKEIF